MEVTAKLIRRNEKRFVIRFTKDLNRSGTYRQVDALRPAKLAELVLLPNRVALHLVDCWWHTCDSEQILQLLAGEIAHANGTSFA